MTDPSTIAMPRASRRPAALGPFGLLVGVALSCSSESGKVADAEGGGGLGAGSTTTGQAVSTGGEATTGGDVTTGGESTSGGDPATGTGASGHGGQGAGGSGSGAGGSGSGGMPCSGPTCCSPDADCLYMAPSGNDALDGSSPANAVQTLGRVHQLIVPANMTRPLEVRIAQGTYNGPGTPWTKSHPVHPIKLIPADYHYGAWGSFAGRPVFDGQHHCSYWLYVNGSGDTNLKIYYLRIEKYRRGGVALINASDNLLFGNYFYRLGSKWSSSGNCPGYGAISPYNGASDNVIQNNHFVEIENAPTEAGLIHALYFAHGADDNVVANSVMTDVSGDAIRVRNDSSGNNIHDNVMIRTGAAGFFGDWYNDPSGQCTNANHSGNQECPSWNNVFHDNDMFCGYDDMWLPAFFFHHDKTCIPPGCANGGTRLTTYGNFLSCNGTTWP